MEWTLALVYLAIGVGLIVALVRTAKRPVRKKWLFLYTTQILLICAAYALMRYFDSLPGTGMFAGIQYFAQTMYSLGAVILYGIQFVISLAVHAVMLLRRK